MRPGAGAIVLAAGAVLYAGIVAATSARPGAGAWGFNAPGFLPGPVRALLLVAMLAAAALVVVGTVRRAGARGPGGQGAPARDAVPRPLDWRAHWPWLLIPAWLALAYVLRVAEPLLGDAYVLVTAARLDRIEQGSEPLSAAVIDAFAGILRAQHRTIDQRSLGILSLLLAVPAAGLFAAIARRISPGPAWGVPFVLLLTLGTAQVYFGYVETYGVALLLILAYLLLGIRCAQGATPPLLPGLALGGAVAAHLSAIHLLPSYALLLFRGTGGRAWRTVLLLVPPAAAAALLALLGYAPAKWVHPFTVATMAAREETTAEVYVRPYGLVSAGHLADLGNALALAAPVAMLLAAAGLAQRLRGRAPLAPHLGFLGVAAASGLLLSASLMTPVAPAQDWDLYAMFLLPLAIFGIAIGVSPPLAAARGLAGAGLAGLSAAALLSFALVNARSEAAIQRFGVVSTDPARVSPFGRAYAGSTLEQLFRERADHSRALEAALATMEAEPHNPRHWTNVGNDLLALGRVEEAARYLERAVARDPHRWEAQYNLGLCYMRMERYGDALARFRGALEGGSDRPEVWHNLGLAHYRGGQADSAVLVWTHVLRRWPDYAASLNMRQGGAP